MTLPVSTFSAANNLGTRLRLSSRVSPAALERQARLCAVERLDLRLFVAAQHQRMLGRFEKQAHDALELPGDLRVAGELEGLDPMRTTVEALAPGYSANSRLLQ